MINEDKSLPVLLLHTLMWCFRKFQKFCPPQKKKEPHFFRKFQSISDNCDHTDSHLCIIVDWFIKDIRTYKNMYYGYTLAHVFQLFTIIHMSVFFVSPYTEVTEESVGDIFSLHGSTLYAFVNWPSHPSMHQMHRDIFSLNKYFYSLSIHICQGI